MDTNRIITGDCLNVLADLPAESVHSVMTSPPYWNLRDYDHDDQLGLEPDSDDYVQNIADVMDGVKRVLRPDGSLWLNLGNTYDDKNLQQIPARVALELQQRGWILRNRVTWAKPNPMPQSVKDRLNDTTEAIFHFVKSKGYWYDLDAIREPYGEFAQRVQENPQWERTGEEKRAENSPGKHVIYDEGKSRADAYHPAGKNPGDVFEVTTKPFPEAHFAVYPPELCEKPIKATVPPKVCVECGSPYERDKTVHSGSDTNIDGDMSERGVTRTTEGLNKKDQKEKRYKATFHGWGQSCPCDSDTTDAGIILDPFAGAGTTCMVADELGRRWTGIDINPEYVDIADERMGVTKSEHKSATDW